MTRRFISVPDSINPNITRVMYWKNSLIIRSGETHSISISPCHEDWFQKLRHDCHQDNSYTFHNAIAYIITSKNTNIKESAWKSEYCPRIPKSYPTKCPHATEIGLDCSEEEELSGNGVMRLIEQNYRDNLKGKCSNCDEKFAGVIRCCPECNNIRFHELGEYTRKNVYVCSFCKFAWDSEENAPSITDNVRINDI